MPYLAINESVRSRLEGRLREFVPSVPDLDGSWDYQTDDSIAGVTKQATVPVDNTSSVRNNKTSAAQVPVYDFNAEGQNWETVYPSITFEVIDCSPRFEEYVYQSRKYLGDRYEITQPVPVQPVTDPIDGSLIGSYSRTASARDVEQPMDVMFEVRVYAKDPILSAMLVSYVYSVFAPRDYIRVAQKDGSCRSWDLIFRSYRDLDKREATRSGTPGVEKEYCKVFTYNVEAYLDNTDTAVLVNLVNQRMLRVQTATPAPASSPPDTSDGDT